jgi:hypothetical protein
MNRINSQMQIYSVEMGCERIHQVYGSGQDLVTNLCSLAFI